MSGLVGAPQPQIKRRVVKPRFRPLRALAALRRERREGRPNPTASIRAWSSSVRPRSRYLSYPALLAALLSLVLAIATAAETLAHHPGSHAARQGDGRVRLDVSAVVPDACTAVASVERGAPPSM